MYQLTKFVPDARLQWLVPRHVSVMTMTASPCPLSGHYDAHDLGAVEVAGDGAVRVNDDVVGAGHEVVDREAVRRVQEFVAEQRRDIRASIAGLRHTEEDRSAAHRRI